MKTKLTILALCVSASGFLFAQTTHNLPNTVNANQDADTIETISILSSRTPIDKHLVAGSISIINQAQIEASGALSLSDLLRTIPSVNISQSGPLGALSELRFRGSESNHVLVMLDGVEINDLGQGGLIDLSHIVLANIEHIEILRGPQSALWGSSAIGGIINIRSKSLGTSKAVEGNASLGYGNKNTANIGLGLSGQSGEWQYAFSASRLDTDGENIARTGDEDDGYTNTSAYGKLAYDFSAYNRISSNLRMVDYRNEFDATDFSTGLLADADNHSDGEQLSLAVNWFYTRKDSIWSQTLSYQYSKQENSNFSAGSFSGSTKGEKQRLVYNHHFTLSKGHINAGLEGVQEDFEQAGPIVFGDPNQTQSNNTISVIADTLHSVNEKLSLSGSVRFDNNDEFDDATSYRVGMNYQFNASLRAYASYGQAIKNPTFTERFGFFPGTFLGNPDLKPETSKSIELGIDLTVNDIDLQLSWYRASLEDEILGFVFDANTGLFTAQNANTDSEREGLELSLAQRFKDWHWSLSYAYLDAKDATVSGDPTIELRRAPHTGSAWLAFDIGKSQQIYLQADYTGTRLDRFFPPFPEPAQTLSLDNYWLISANYRYQIHPQHTINLRLSNALDTEYEDVIGFSGESMRIFAAYEYTW